jgi:hypothetical protein
MSTKKYDGDLAELAAKIWDLCASHEGEDNDGALMIEGIIAPMWEDKKRVDKLDAVLQEDPFCLRMKWDNYQDSGVYIFDGLGKQIGHAPQPDGDDDPEDSTGLTIRAAIDSIQ